MNTSEKTICIDCGKLMRINIEVYKMLCDKNQTVIIKCEKCADKSAKQNINK